MTEPSVLRGGEGGMSLYPWPKTQELSRLARKIRGGENDLVKQAVQSNPRLLCTMTDGPTILHEGFRYNALHQAARYGNTEIGIFILSVINGHSFMRDLFPDDLPSMRNERTRYLTDMYLNSPERGALETPLHICCKYNHYKLAKVLLSHPLCDPTVRNKHEKTAEQVIGIRAQCWENFDEISRLFVDTMIVPIWRGVYNESQPIVGKPVNPKKLGLYIPAPFTTFFGDIVMDLFGPPDKDYVPKVSFCNEKVIRAFAGPMSEKEAAEFYQSLRLTAVGGLSVSLFNQKLTPPNTAKTTVGVGIQITPQLNPILNSLRNGPMFTSTPNQDSPSRRSEFTLRSPLSGQEFTPKTLSLLLTSPRNNNFLTGKSPCASTLREDKSIRLADPDKGIERVGLKYAHEMSLPWSEYWEFLDEFCDLTSEAGLMMLEEHLKRQEQLGLAESLPIPNVTPVSQICGELGKLALGSGKTPHKVWVNGNGIWEEDWRKGLRGTRPINGFNDQEIKMQKVKNAFLENVDLGVCGDAASASSAPIKAKIKPKRLFPNISDTMSSGDNSCNTIFNLREWDEDSDSDEDTWVTAPSSPLPDNPVFEFEYEECDTYAVFINGAKPGKEDYQAYRALSPIMNDVPGSEFPNVLGWYNSLKASGDSFRKV